MTTNSSCGMDRCKFAKAIISHLSVSLLQFERQCMQQVFDEMLLRNNAEMDGDVCVVLRNCGCYTFSGQLECDLRETS
jgi:hypothetical protein